MFFTSDSSNEDEGKHHISRLVCLSSFVIIAASSLEKTLLEVPISQASIVTAIEAIAGIGYERTF
jgi:hypothetical protein